MPLVQRPPWIYRGGRRGEKPNLGQTVGSLIGKQSIGLGAEVIL